MDRAKTTSWENGDAESLLMELIARLESGDEEVCTEDDTERRFVVDGAQALQWISQLRKSRRLRETEIKQGYLVRNEKRYRLRQEGGHYYSNAKSDSTDEQGALLRVERKVALTLDQYQLIDTLVRERLSKRRFSIEYPSLGIRVDIDVYEGNHAPLVIVEVGLLHKDDNAANADWSHSAQILRGKALPRPLVRMVIAEITDLQLAGNATLASSETLEEYWAKVEVANALPQDGRKVFTVRV